MLWESKGNWGAFRDLAEGSFRNECQGMPEALTKRYTWVDTIVVEKNGKYKMSSMTKGCES